VARDSVTVQVGGNEITTLYGDLVRLEVELDDDLAGMFRLTLALLLDGDGTWRYLDDGDLVPWQQVVITAGTQDDTRELIRGYITHLRPSIDTELDRCRLEVWGMDASVLMDREDVLKDWPNKKDSDIARETFQKHHLSVEVTDTQVVHDEKVSTIIQRETDMQFLRRLAARNGFECFVDGTTGYFRPPSTGSPGQPVLAVQFGEQTNLIRFAVEANALAPAAVTMSQVDHLSKAVLNAAAQPAVQPALGARPIDAYLGPGMVAGEVRLGRVVTTGMPEMTAICQRLHDQGEWFVTGEGELDSTRYGGILTPRATVVVKGAGRTHSGVYYVTRVTHTFTPDAYTQVFSVKRNALEATGAEDFARVTR
jgi:phage protein D